MRLARSADLFADDAALESTAGPVAFDLNRVYSGRLEGDQRKQATKSID